MALDETPDRIEIQIPAVYLTHGNTAKMWVNFFGPELALIAEVQGYSLIVMEGKRVIIEIHPNGTADWSKG